jgi:hypothetical protein
MFKRLTLLLLLAAIALPLTSCVVAPERPYPGAYWVPGHYGPEGGWHPGHWS